LKFIPSFLQREEPPSPAEPKREVKSRVPEAADAAIIRRGLQQIFGKHNIHDVTTHKGADGLPEYHVAARADFSRKRLFETGIVTGTAELERKFHTIKIPAARLIADAQKDAAFGYNLGLAQIPCYTVTRAEYQGHPAYIIETPQEDLAVFEKLGIPQTQIAEIGFFEDARQVAIPTALIADRGLNDFHSMRSSILATYAEHAERSDSERGTFWDNIAVPARQDPAVASPAKPTLST